MAQSDDDAIKIFVDAENGLVEPKEKGSDRVTLAPRNYHAVLRILRNRHLLLE